MEENLQKAGLEYFCYSLPTLDTNIDEFTLDAGSTRWYFFDMIKDQILEDPEKLLNQSDPNPQLPGSVTSFRHL